MTSIAYAADWKRSAACRSADPDIFFDPSTEDGSPTASRNRHLRRASAKEFCATCPVVNDCLKEHIDEPFGVFGGLDQDERAVLRSRAEKMRPIDQRRIGKAINDLRQQGVSWEACAESVGRGLLEAKRLHSVWLGSAEGKVWLGRERIIEQLRKRVPMYQIAKNLRVSSERVSAVAQEIGLRRPPHERVPQEMRDRIVEMSEHGATVVRITEATGVPEANVYAIVKEHRRTKDTVPMHSRADAWVLSGGQRTPAEYLGQSNEERPMYFMRMLTRDQTRRWLSADEVKFIRPVTPMQLVRAGAERSQIAASQTRARRGTG